MDEKVFDSVPKKDNIGKNVGDAVAGNVLNKRSEGKNTSEELENQAKTVAKSAIAAGKATAKASAGDVVGAVKDVAKDEGLRKLILATVIAIICIPIMMCSLVPNVLLAPTEEAYSDNHHRVTLMDIIKGLFHKNADTEVNLFTANSIDTALNELVKNKMINDNSLKVIASDNETIPDFDVAPNNANITMQNMIKATQYFYEKRHKALLQYVDDDFNSRKRHLKGNVTKVITDPLANGTTTTAQEAVKLMALYSVMNDDNIEGISFDDFREWLGDETAGFFFKKDDDGYESWHRKPKKWQGSMLSQKLYDQKRREINDGTFKNDNYKDNYTSALSEILKVNPEVSENTYENVYYTTDEITGEQKRHVEYYSIITYSINVKSVDDICENIVKFNEAVTLDNDGKPVKLDMASHREEYYKELCGMGEGEGVALKYFGVQGGTLYGGGVGNGSDIVKVAVSQIGVVEIPENYVLYNDWYYGAHIGGPNAPWCATFVSWCANECGYIDSGIIPKGAHCSVFRGFYGDKGAAASVADTSFIPKPGDLIIRTGDAHIGIVEKYENGTLYTIEGNSGIGISDVNNNGGCVARHAYGTGQSRSILNAWGSGGIYCRPEYPMTSDGIGAVCFAFETGGQQFGKANPWYCEDIQDGAGMNYGMMSTNRGQAQSLYNYIIANSENFKKQIGSRSMFSAEFNKWWTGQHSDTDTEEMSALQSAWVWQAYGEPVCAGNYTYLKRSRALQEMALSRAVHRGYAGARSMFSKAGIDESMTDEQIINAIYDFETAHITPSYLRPRMILEKNMIKDNFL